MNEIEQIQLYGCPEGEMIAHKPTNVSVKRWINLLLAEAQRRMDLDYHDRARKCINKVRYWINQL